jgi:hypothetical protein
MHENALTIKAAGFQEVTPLENGVLFLRIFTVKTGIVRSFTEPDYESRHSLGRIKCRAGQLEVMLKDANPDRSGYFRLQKREAYK